jgi:tetratricopeptide (TPR) repeat protein/tRNA A-37 threonylcarbamoyl transferase component Bud32
MGQKPRFGSKTVSQRDAFKGIHMQADRHLLLGLLALQCDFITKYQLVTAFRDWTSNKSRSLEQILTDNKAINPQQQSLLAALVEEHLKQHDNDPEKSLASLSSLPTITHELQLLGNAELNASLLTIKVKEPYAELVKTDNFDNLQAQSGRFIVLRAHAKGGLGQVSVALDSELNRQVALKEMLDKYADDSASQQRFVQEAEITGQLEHPGIVPVYGLGTYGNGRPYYAMRFVEGDNLRHAVERFHKSRRPNEQLTGARAVEFRNLLGRFVDVCNAIEYAHSRQVLHRDLKPDNVLLGPYGETLVVDWGLAKALGKDDESVQDFPVRPVKPRSGSHGETLEGSAIGTPAYMSPEQAFGKVQSLGPATDVYSLGATLYAVLTGAPPVQGDTQVDTLDKVRRGEIERPHKVWTSVPKPLEAACLKAMSLKPCDRYASARSLADEIEKWLADEPVSAYQEPIGVRARRWIKRHPSVVSATAACTLLGLSGALIFAALQGAHTKELEGKNKTISDQVVEVTKRKEEAERERSRAEEREQDAIAAVKRFGDAVSSNYELKNNPKLETLRKELLKEPLGFFKQLKERLQNNGSTSKESLDSLAGASFDLASLTDQIGDKQDAIAAYKEAISIRERLAREHPYITEFQIALAISRQNLGDLLSQTGKRDEATEAHQQARTTLEQLARETPSITKLQSALALSRINLGVSLSETGKPDEAIAAFQQAKTTLELLARENPSVTGFQSALATSCDNLGTWLSKTGKPVEALAVLEQAQTTLEQLVRDNPSVASFQDSLAYSHTKLGDLLSQTGKPYEALAAYERAKAIREQLAIENPSVTDLQSALASTCNNLGALLTQTGKTEQAIAAFEQAKNTLERLARENPSVMEFQNSLARSYINIGFVLGETGKLAEALVALKKAKATLEQLAQENPSVTDFQLLLAGSLSNLGLFLSQINEPDEALAAYEQAKTILQRLVQENNSVIEYLSNLAQCHNNLGNLLSQFGKTEQALAAFEHAKTNFEQLAMKNPSVTEFQSDLGGSLNNLATIHLDFQRFDQARDLLREAIKFQKAALENNPQHPVYRRFLKNHYMNLIKTANGLHDKSLESEARAGLLEVAVSDSQFAEIDQRLKEVSAGEVTKDVQEVLTLAARAYDLQEFVLAAKLYGDAISQAPTLVEDRQLQILYNAACSAALAASGQSFDTPPLDESAKTKLRSEALTWLKQELTQWQKLFDDGPEFEAKQTVTKTLAHWQKDSDLASIRDVDKLSALPEAERKEWEAFWTEMKELHAKVSAEVATPSMKPKDKDATGPQ